MRSFLSFLLSFQLLLSCALTPAALSPHPSILFAEEKNAETPMQALSASITAPSAVLMEMSTGTVIFEKDPHAIRHPASITKIMTLLLTFEALDAGKVHYQNHDIDFNF